MVECSIAPKLGPLVSATWLKDNKAEVLLLDASVDRGLGSDGRTVFVSGQSLFEQAHIPGARFADLMLAFSDPTAPFPFTRPTFTQLTAQARLIGIGQHTRVVVYDSLTGAWAARIWWLLRAAGLEQVHVLDGGLRAWRAIGGAIEIGPSTSSWDMGDISAKLQSGFFVDLPDVQAMLGETQGKALVCGLRRPEFLGTGSSDPRAGHIPGSINIPYAELLRPDGTLDLEETKQQWCSQSLSAKATVVLYCGGGINAAGLALAFTAAGLGPVTLYDGSLSEWRADPNLPLVKDEA